MNLLLVASADPWTRSVATIHHYAAVGRELGHTVAVYGYPNPELPGLTFTTDLDGVDHALFVLQVTWDLPDMPDLARLLDGIPRARRTVADLWGRFNDTIRVEHDFNHLEKLDGHPAVEWIEAMEAISATVLQPTLTPRRRDVRPFLFHAFNERAVQRPHKTAREAAAAWASAQRPYGAIYVGSNWQRWGQVRQFLERYAPARAGVGPACLAGWDWGTRPQWAVDNGILGIDTDAAFLVRQGVEVRDGVRFDQVVELLGQARFAPVFHRPLFRELGLATNRTFETFYADALPVLMLPRDFVGSIYGPAALALVPGDDLAAHLADALAHPERQWEAVIETRAHLAKHHSYAGRFEELGALIAGRSGAAP